MTKRPTFDVRAHHDRALREFRLAAETADIVSFDLFDTLVGRVFARPTDLFAAMGAHLSSINAAFGRSFADRRVAAEREARRRHPEKADVTLEDVYRHFSFFEGASRPLPAVTELIDLECEMEVASAVVDPQVYAAFVDLYQRRRCVVTSDMYLPRRCIERILAVAGVPADVPLFLSGECGGSKRDGSVWALVRDRLDLDPFAKIAHLDDNGGIAGVRNGLPGLTVALLPSPEDRLPRHTPAEGAPDWFRGVCEAMFAQSLWRGRDRSASELAWIRIAHSVVVPLVFGLARKVRDVAASERVDRVYFLARDGLVVAKAYDGCFSDAGMPASPYLLASRRCLNMATIVALGETDVDFLCSGYSRRTVGQYLSRVGLDVSDPAVIEAIARRFVGPDASVVTGADQAALRGLFSDLSGLIETRGCAEREPLLAYLDGMGLFHGPSIIVDVGWHGSLQRSLSLLGAIATGSKPDLLGVYVGLIPPLLSDSDGKRLRTRSWLFDGNGPSEAMDLVRRCIDLVELFFSAPEHGVDHFEPTLDGTPVVVRNVDCSEDARMTAATLFHEVVESVAVRMRPFRHCLTAEVLDQAALSALEDFVLHPTAETVGAIGSLSHAEGFGDSGYRALLPTVPVGSSRWDLKTAHDTASWKEGLFHTLDVKSRLRLALVRRESSLRRAFEASVSRVASSVRRTPRSFGPLPAETSLLVVITAHYVEARLGWLRQTLEPYSRYPCPVRVVVNVNEISPAEQTRMEAMQPPNLDVEFRVQRGLETPYHLAWCHKPIIVDEFLQCRYTHFVYVEDDIVIEPEAFLYWHQTRAPLRRHGLVPGFVRVEHLPSPDRWFATDQFDATQIDWMRVRRAWGLPFTNLDSAYTACFVLDRELAEEHVRSTCFTEDGSSVTKSNWGLRERAAMGIAHTDVPRFFISRMVVPFDRRTLQVPWFARVIHVAGNYASDAHSDLAKLPVERLFAPPTFGHFVRQRGKTARRLVGLPAF